MADPVIVEINLGSDWRSKFRLIEMAMLGIAPADWQASLPKQLKTIRTNYSFIHNDNVNALNAGLASDLAIPLRSTDFSGDTTLQGLRENVVRPRIRPSTPLQITLSMDEEELKTKGMEHFLG